MSFSSFNLNPKVLQAVQLCGYQNPTPIQQRCIPAILSKKDVIAFAQTGTGKTAAFVLPALHLLSLKEHSKSKRARILILTPTRELAHQITSSIKNYGKFLNFRTVNLVGGMSYHEQFKKLAGPLDFIVATPGRLLDHLKNHKLDLTNIEMLVLDESDRMLDMGFIEDVKKIELATPRNKQVLLFSATSNPSLDKIIKKLLHQPICIDLSEPKRAPLLIKQDLYLANDSVHKVRLLKHLLEKKSIYKSIIFSATKKYADKLARELGNMGLLVAVLHGDLKQSVRNRTLEQFRCGKIQYLVATDIAARGLDINDITHIINFDLPKFSEDYVHRIGRTGRAGKPGHAISFALASDAIYLSKIEAYTKQIMERITVEGLEPNEQIAHSKNHKSFSRQSKNKTMTYGKLRKIYNDNEFNTYRDKKKVTNIP